MISPQVGWALDTEGHILRTMNGGFEWKTVSSSTLTRAVASEVRPPGLGSVAALRDIVAFPTSQTAWVMREVGQNQVDVWHTTTGGRIWSQSRIHPAVLGGLGYAYLSAAGNQAWVLCDTQGMAGHVYSTLWHTTNGEAHWQALWSGNTNATGLTFVSPTRGVEPQALIVSNHTSPFFLTTDAGKRWHRTALSFPPGSFYPAASPPQVISGQMVAIVTLTPAPTAANNNPTTAPERWLYASTSAGATWHPMSRLPGPLFSDTRAVRTQWVSPRRGWVWDSRSNPTLLFQTHDGGRQCVHVAVPQGQSLSLQWLLTTEAYDLVQVDGQSNLYRTQDGGDHWSRIPTKIHGP